MKQHGPESGSQGPLGQVCSPHLHLSNLFVVRPWANYLTFLTILLCIMGINNSPTSMRG